MKESWQTLNMIFLALLAGQIIFLLVVVYLYYSGNQVKGDSTIGPILAGSALALSGAAWFIRQKLLSRVVISDDAEEKLINYRSIVLPRLAIAEGGTLMAIIGFYLTNKMWVLVIAGICLGVFYLLRPLKEEFISLYKLSSADKQELMEK